MLTLVVRFLQINGISLDNFSTVQEVNRYIGKVGSYVAFSVLKYSISSPQPSLLSSSASSGHNLTESSPDALSASPKSPDTRLWDNTSPDSNKISLKSSGSQTDSLDSPPPSGRSPTRGGGGMHGSGQVLGPADKRYVNIFGKPFGTTSDTGARGSGGLRGSGLSEERSVGVSPATSHDSPPPLPSHPPPPLPSPHRTTEEEVIDDLNAIINHYTKSPAPVTLSGSKDKRTRSRDKEDNAGTWPMRRSPLDYQNGAQPFPPAVVKNKERPPLSVIASDHAYVLPNTSPSTGGDKVAPTPPERSDSFNRSKTINSSIKHSPQASAEPSKYAAVAAASGALPLTSSAPLHVMTSTETSSGMTHHIATHTPSHPPYLMTSPNVKSSSYTSSPMSSKSPHTPQTMGEKDGKKAAHSSSGHSSTDGAKVSSHYYGTGGTSPQAANTHVPDTTVESANNDEILRSYYERRNQPNRPNSAPGLRNRDKRKELAQKIHGGGAPHPGSGRTVPTSLDIQPIYSPRPVPHSRGIITPSSHGHASRGGGAISPISTAQAYPSRYVRLPCLSVCCFGSFSMCNTSIRNAKFLVFWFSQAKEGASFWN